MKNIIKQAREQVAEARAEEAASLIFILGQLRYWKRLYLKKNQPLNYFRVTCSIPPGMEEAPYFWFCKFQIWKQTARMKEAKLEMDITITPEAYKFFTEDEELRDMGYISGDKGWKRSSDNPMNYICRRPI